MLICIHWKTRVGDLYPIGTAIYTAGLRSMDTCHSPLREVNGAILNCHAHVIANKRPIGS